MALNFPVRTAVSPIEELKQGYNDGCGECLASVRTAVSPIEELKRALIHAHPRPLLVRTAVSPIEELKPQEEINEQTTHYRQNSG